MGKDKDKDKKDKEKKDNKEKSKEAEQKQKEKEEKKEKKEKKKEEKKKEKEKKEKEKEKAKAAEAKVNGASKKDVEVESSKAPATEQEKKAEEPPEKKLKAWQDDELEVDSDDGGNGPASAASKSAGASSSAEQVFKKVKLAETTKKADDSLDAFMDDIFKSEQAKDDEQRAKAGKAGPKKDVAASRPADSMSVMDASRVKTITLEEVQALMAGGKEDVSVASSSSAAPAAAEPGTAAAVQGASSAAPSAAPKVATDPSQDKTPPAVEQADDEGGDEDEDDKFHAAFIAEIRRQQQGSSERNANDEQSPPAPAAEAKVEEDMTDKPEFIKAAEFQGRKVGYIFTTRGRPKKTGYYLDRGPFGEHLTKGKDQQKVESKSKVELLSELPRIRFPQFMAAADDDTEILGFVPTSFPPKPVFVKSVDPGSWAEQNGIQIDDELVLVNGQDPMKSTKSELLAMMRARPVTLAFARHELPTEEKKEEEAADVSADKEKPAQEGFFDFRRSAVKPKKDDDDGESDEDEDNGDNDADDEEEDKEEEKCLESEATCTAAPAAPAALASSSSAAPAAPALAESQPPAPNAANAADVETEPGEKKVLSKKEKRRLRREAKEREATGKAEKAKKQFASSEKDADDAERMESDPDQSEQSSLEEEPLSYFDLVQKFTTKKTLPTVDHSLINYKSFNKNLYIQVKEITNMKDHEVDDLRKAHGDIRVRGKNCPKPIKSFLQCGLPKKILKIFEDRDYDRPFPIQMQAIPALMTGKDVIGVAQTGSGKTLAYLLPLIRHIMDQPPLADGDGPIGFIIAPTRELALQIQREANTFCKAVGLTSVCAFGGGPMGEQLSALRKGAELLVGTPGRLIDVLTTSNGKITNLRRVTFMVLDEADRMFDMGFEPQIGMFMQGTRPDKQIALFSATLPTHVEALARTVLKKPIEITVGERNTAASNVTQFVEVLDETQKFYRLLQLLGEWHEHGSIIIFVQHQKDVDEMFTELLKYGYPSLALHGGQDQHDRDFTLQDFKDKVATILIATSVAARGIDVKDVILVINFKVPDYLEDYIHRIGRTGRAGKHGYAYTFIQPDEGDRAQDMLDALRQCGQEVPDKLRALTEEYQSLVNTGQATKRRRWGGFGGKHFKLDSTEHSRQMKERRKAKDDFLIGEVNEEEEEFKDPWDEDKPMNEKKKDNKPKPPAEQPKHQSITGSDPSSTAKAAAQVAAQLQEAAGAPAPKPAAPPPVAKDPNSASNPSVVKPKAKAHILAPRKKTETEIDEEAERKAEETLINLPEDVRIKQLPKVKERIKQQLLKVENEVTLMPPPAPPKPPPAAAVESPLMKATMQVPGVIGVPASMAQQQPSMVTRSMDQLTANMASNVSATAKDAQNQANANLGQFNPNVPPGHILQEFEINDYPQIARQKITHRDPLLAIEELTGCKLWVKGQYFADERKIPEGARKLYVEIIGPNTVATTKAKNEVRSMMEQLAIRTLNIPGLGNRQLGQPGKYDPMTGR